jgi:hypothetical protein
VKTAAEENGDLAASARSYLGTYEKRTAELKRGRGIVNILAMAAGALALMEIPAAYELVKKRFLLIAPAALCLLCAAVAAALYALLGLGQMYAALAVAVFALVQLLIVLPRRKRPAYQPKH